MVALSSERLSVAARHLPGAPQTFSKLDRLLKDLSKHVGDVTQLLRADMVLSAAVIRLANSPVFARGGPAGSLEAAVNRVGFREVHRLVALASAAAVLRGDLVMYRCAGAQVWENSLATAVAAELVARSCSADPAVAYTTGLLRSIGKVLIDRLLTAEPAEVRPAAYPGASADLRAWELRTFGLTSPDVAAIILRDWHFPDATVLPIRHQQGPHQASGHEKAAACLHLGVCLSGALGKGLPGEDPLFTQAGPAATMAGLKEKQIFALIPLIREELNRVKALLAGL